MLNPLPVALVEVAVATIAVGWVMVKVRVAVHALASVTVTVWFPAAKPVLLAEVPPPDQLYVYGLVPPEGLTLAAPVVPPKQATLVCDALVVEIAVGWVMVTDLVVVLLLASVMVTV